MAGRLRNTNTQPLNGSWRSASLQTLRQAVDAPAKVRRLDGHQNPHLWCDLDHDAGFQKLRQSAARSGGAAVFR